MKKYKVGEKVRIGGIKGPIETITEVNKNGIKVVSGNSTGYIKYGDAAIIPVKEYEQLTLF